MWAWGSPRSAKAKLRDDPGLVGLTFLRVSKRIPCRIPERRKDRSGWEKMNKLWK